MGCATDQQFASRFEVCQVVAQPRPLVRVRLPRRTQQLLPHSQTTHHLLHLPPRNTIAGDRSYLEHSHMLLDGLIALSDLAHRHPAHTALSSQAGASCGPTSGAGEARREPTSPRACPACSARESAQEQHSLICCDTAPKPNAGAVETQRPQRRTSGKLPRRGGFAGQDAFGRRSSAPWRQVIGA